MRTPSLGGGGCHARREGLPYDATFAADLEVVNET